MKMIKRLGHSFHLDVIKDMLGKLLLLKVGREVDTYVHFEDRALGAYSPHLRAVEDLAFIFRETEGEKNEDSAE